jgi:hypothetical protein
MKNLRGVKRKLKEWIGGEVVLNTDEYGIYRGIAKEIEKVKEHRVVSHRTHLKILQAMRKPARRTKARKVDSRLSCRTVNLRNPPFSHPKNRSTLLRALR